MPGDSQPPKNVVLLDRSSSSHQSRPWSPWWDGLVYVPVPVLVLWIRIRIRMYPHHFGNLDPHQCMEYESIWAPFSRGWAFILEAIIWTRIRIRTRMKCRIESASNKNQNPDPHPDPHQGDKSNPDPHQRDADPQHWPVHNNTEHSCLNHPPTVHQSSLENQYRG